MNTISLHFCLKVSSFSNVQKLLSIVLLPLPLLFPAWVQFNKTLWNQFGLLFLKKNQIKIELRLLVEYSQVQSIQWAMHFGFVAEYIKAWNPCLSQHMHRIIEWAATKKKNTLNRLDLWSVVELYLWVFGRSTMSDHFRREWICLSEWVREREKRMKENPRSITERWKTDQKFTQNTN